MRKEHHNQVSFMNEPSLAFMLEEYRNIAATHDKLRDAIVRIFNYFLILSAFPFTVAGFMLRDADLLPAPLSLHLLFLAVGIGHLFLALELVEARLAQYRYARTVNLVRKYFAEQDKDLKNYLYLPISEEVPDWRDLGFVGWQVRFVIVVGALFVFYGVLGFFSITNGLVIGSLIFLIYCSLFKWLKRGLVERYKKRVDIERASLT
jgi:small-conductance mechanosensitive channel